MRNTMKPIWKDWAKHKKPTKQIDILKIIASKGIQSETTLIEKLNLEDFKKLNSLTDKNKKKDKDGNIKENVKNIIIKKQVF